MASDKTKLNQACPELKNIENREVQYFFLQSGSIHVFIYFIFFFIFFFKI